jgi:hypothetical protein
MLSLRLLSETLYQLFRFCPGKFFKENEMELKQETGVCGLTGT